MLLSCYELWDYLTHTGRNEFSEWRTSLSVEDQARLDQKLNSLMTVEFDLLWHTKVLQGPINKSKFIYKLRVMSKDNLRPLLCKGPLPVELAYTLLKGAWEKDRDLTPSGAVATALKNRAEVLNDPKARRKRRYG